jgi:hypothetical protein
MMSVFFIPHHGNGTNAQWVSWSRSNLPGFINTEHNQKNATKVSVIGILSMLGFSCVSYETPMVNIDIALHSFAPPHMVEPNY